MKRAFTPDDDWTGPRGLQWMNAQHLLESLEGRLLCTECGCCDLAAEPEETLRGTGAVWSFWCERCVKYTFELYTQNRLRLGKRGPPTFEGNIRLATWAMRTGGGYASVVALCSDMDMPAPAPNSFNAAMEHVSTSFRATSEEAVEEACTAERAALIASGVPLDEDGALATSCTFDGSWPKRYGFNALWGFTSMRSRMTKQILGFSLHHKQCATCDTAARFSILGVRASARSRARARASARAGARALELKIG